VLQARWLRGGRKGGQKSGGEVSGGLRAVKRAVGGRAAGALNDQAKRTTLSDAVSPRKTPAAALSRNTWLQNAKRPHLRGSDQATPLKQMPASDCRRLKEH